MFIELLDVYTIGRFGGSLFFNSERRLPCISGKNQPSQTRPRLVNINSNKTVFYLFI